MHHLLKQFSGHDTNIEPVASILEIAFVSVFTYFTYKYPAFPFYFYKFLTLLRCIYFHCYINEGPMCIYLDIVRNVNDKILNI